jgi:capsular polysaccharide transport system permease protein
VSEILNKPRTKNQIPQVVLRRRRRLARLRQQQSLEVQDYFPVLTPVEGSAVAAPEHAAAKSRNRAQLCSFLLLVALPLLISATYLYARAADQFVSTVAFTVRREEISAPVDMLGSLGQFSGLSSSDSDILYEFIQSQALVAGLDRQIGLRQLYGKAQNDPVFSLAQGSPIEELMLHWSRMTRLSYDSSTGLIELQARAFTASDARVITTAVLEQSDAMINALSLAAQQDSTRFASEELDQAAQTMRTARNRLQQYRREQRIIDPIADLQGQMGLLNRLQSQLATALIDLDLLTETTRQSDPRLRQGRRKIVVIKARIDAERQSLGTGSGPQQTSYADIVGQFESLQADLDFSERAWITARAAYDLAQAEARRQSRYLAAYIQPTLAETAQYPRRATTLLVMAFFLAGLWSCGVLIFYSLRDRR